MLSFRCSREVFIKSVYFLILSLSSIGYGRQFHLMEHAELLGMIPPRKYSIPTATLDKRPVVIYLTVDSKEPFMKIAIDQEIHSLKKICDRTAEVGSVVIIGSALSDQLARGEPLSINFCAGSYKWRKYEIPPELTQVIRGELAKYQNNPNFQLIKKNIVVIPEVMEGILKEVFKNIFDPEKYAFFFQIKSHGDGPFVIDLLNSKVEDSKVNEQKGLMEKMGFGSYLALAEQPVSGDGKLGELVEKIAEKKVFLGFEDNKTNSLSRGEGMYSGADPAQTISSFGMSKIDLEKVFRHLKQMGVDTLALFQESCNSPLLNRNEITYKNELQDEVFNYFRYPGLLGYHNLNWLEIVNNGYNTQGNVAAARKLWHGLDMAYLFGGDAPGLQLFMDIETFVWSHNENKSSYKKLLDKATPNQVMALILQWNLLGLLNFSERFDWLEVTLDKAFANRTSLSLSEEEIKTLFGHHLNPFYFQNPPARLDFDLDLDLNKKCVFPRENGLLKCSSFNKNDESVLFYEKIIKYLLVKLSVSNLAEVRIPAAKGLSLPINQYWIYDLDSYFLDSKIDLMSMFISEDFTSLDWGFFNRISNDFGLPKDFLVDGQNKPYLNLPIRSEKSGQVLYFGILGWDFTKRIHTYYSDKNKVDHHPSATDLHQTFAPGPFGGEPVFRGRDRYPIQFIKNRPMVLVKTFEWITASHYGNTKLERVSDMAFKDVTVKIPKALEMLDPAGEMVALIWILEGDRFESGIDSSGFGLLKLDKNGNLSKSFGSQGGRTVIKSNIDDSEDSEVIIPVALQVSREKDIFVSAISAKDFRFQTIRIYKFNPNGIPDKSFGTNGYIEVPFLPGYNANYGAQFYVDHFNNILIPVWSHRHEFDDDNLEIANKWQMAESRIHDSGSAPFARDVRSLVTIQMDQYATDYEEPTYFFDMYFSPSQAERLDIYRYNSKGQLDRYFGTNKNGRIEIPTMLSLGTGDPFAKKRATECEPTGANGGFNGNHDYGIAIAQQSDSKYLLQTEITNSCDPIIFTGRFNYNGTPDRSFGN